MARRRWTAACYEFFRFGLKQGWACLFGGIAIALMVVTYRFYPAQATLPRYDFLFLCMISVQAALLALRMETWEEAKVILIYHAVGTAHGDLQDLCRVLDLSGAELFPDRRRAAVFRLHVFLHRQLYLPRLAPVRFPLLQPSATIEPDRAEFCDLRQFLHRSFRARLPPGAVRRERAAVLPHVNPFQGLACLALDAAAARLRAGRAVHLAHREHRHADKDLALSVATAGVVFCFARQARLVVPADHHQLHAGEEPDQRAAAPWRRAPRAGFPTIPRRITYG